jgi:hypothetical protein
VGILDASAVMDEPSGAEANFRRPADWVWSVDSGLPQGLGSRRDRHWRGWIVGWLALLSEIRTEDAIVDGATNLKQQIGAASRPAHLLRFIHRRFTKKLAVPSVSTVPTRKPARWRSA